MRTKYTKTNKINIVTLGCSKNIYDSEILMSQLKANNKNVVHGKDGNVVVINTCGFIENAKKESIDTILEYSTKKKAMREEYLLKKNTKKRNMIKRITLINYENINSITL